MVRGRRATLLMASGVALFACSSTPPPGPAGSAIGGTCQATSDCLEGETPACFVLTLGNVPDGTSVPGGYCSSTCQSSRDCGANGECVDLGAAGIACLQRCGAPSECRDGYSCWSNGFCLPGALDCDPTVGSCSTGGVPGGCSREALGAGLTGQCRRICAIGTGSCSTSGGNTGEHCIFVDYTHEANGTPTHDGFRGTLCAPLPSVPATHGQPCSFAGQCEDGDECNLLGPFMFGQGFDAKGDNRCHRLCTVRGVPCDTGETCVDLWGTLQNSGGAGLCR